MTKRLLVKFASLYIVLNLIYSSHARAEAAPTEIETIKEQMRASLQRFADFNTVLFTREMSKKENRCHSELQTRWGLNAVLSHVSAKADVATGVVTFGLFFNDISLQVDASQKDSWLCQWRSAGTTVRAKHVYVEVQISPDPAAQRPEPKFTNLLFDKLDFNAITVGAGGPPFKPWLKLKTTDAPEWLNRVIEMQLNQRLKSLIAMGLAERLDTFMGEELTKLFEQLRERQPAPTMMLD